MILAVFRSRSQSMDYAERLYKYGIEASMAPAPKEAKIGCGICVRISESNFARANAVLKMGKYSSFKGYYRMEYVGGRPSITPYR